jgi:hypothetical protein
MGARGKAASRMAEVARRFDYFLGLFFGSVSNV